MTSSTSASLLQPFALRAFTALYLLRPSWAGRLVLSLGLDDRGAALSVATNIAGGVSLAIDNDDARLRKVVRSGTTDFVVNTLDEALRAIKNELRKQTPLSVALKADPNAVMEEVLERGLAPQLFARFASLGDDALVERASSEFVSTGAELVDFESPVASSARGSYLALNADEVIAPLLSGEGLSLATCEVESPARLRRLDKYLLEMLPPEDHLRRRWLEGVVKILQRQRPPSRVVWLSVEEQASFKKDGFEFNFR
jgi:urocanate hydratase